MWGRNVGNFVVADVEGTECWKDVEVDDDGNFSRFVIRWEKLSDETKLLMLSGETTLPLNMMYERDVMALLKENEKLLQMIRDGASKEACHQFIIESW